MQAQVGGLHRQRAVEIACFRDSVLMNLRGLEEVNVSTLSSPPPGVVPEYGRRHANSALLRFLDRLTFGSALGGALFMVVLLVLFLAVVGHGAMPAIKQFGWRFLTTSEWSAHPPENEDTGIAPPQVFGARPEIAGTLLTSLIALGVSFPISMGAAVFLVKLAPKFRLMIPRMQGGHMHFSSFSLRHAVTVCSFLIELLAAIPSIAYGLWGVFVLVPFSQKYIQPFLSTTLDINKLATFLPHWHWGLHLSAWPGIGPLFKNTAYGTNMLTAGLILAIMVTPIMTAIIRDVVAVTPPELEQGALGLGATWWQATRLVLGYCKMGILGAVILGFARAIGETMAVTMVIGDNLQPNQSLLAPGQSIASLLAVQFRNADTPGEIHALIYAALVLLVITTLINGIARIMIVRVEKRSVKR